MPVLQRRIDSMPDGSFVLRRATLHLARVTVRTSGHADRCLFRPFSYSWSLPSREYECYLYEHDARRQLIAVYDTRRYSVHFAD